MDSRIDFDINESLKQYLSDPAAIQTPEADPSLLDCESDTESLTSGLINSVLNPVVEAIAENPEALSRSSVFDSLQFLLKCATSPVSTLLQRKTGSNLLTQTDLLQRFQPMHLAKYAMSSSLGCRQRPMW